MSKNNKIHPTIKTIARTLKKDGLSGLKEKNILTVGGRVFSIGYRMLPFPQVSLYAVKEEKYVPLNKEEEKILEKSIRAFEKAQEIKLRNELL